MPSRELPEKRGESAPRSSGRFGCNQLCPTVHELQITPTKAETDWPDSRIAASMGAKYASRIFDSRSQYPSMMSVWRRLTAFVAAPAYFKAR